VADNDDNTLTWRALNREGCEQGRLIKVRVDKLESKITKTCDKVDKLTWALVGFSITFGTAALLLALNLIVR
jgi:hypothetical protein